MPIGCLTLEIHLAEARSLKDKRQVIESLKERLRRRFNVAVAELDYHDLWQRSLIGIVSISPDGHHLEQALRAVLRIRAAAGARPDRSRNRTVLSGTRGTWRAGHIGTNGWPRRSGRRFRSCWRVS